MLRVRKNNVVNVMLAAVCLLLWSEYKTCLSERVSYFSTERPNITYYNKKYVSFLNVSSRRPGRSSLIHYVDFHITTLIEGNNTLKWDFYFYEFLSNTYRRSFVEMHYLTCDLILKDKIFGSALRQTIKECPVPPGTYRVTNCSIPRESVPGEFPFRKGRIYCNVTLTPTKELVMSAHIDMELKEFTRNTRS